MNFKNLGILGVVILFLILFLFLFAMSAWPAETKNCIPVIEGEARITSVTAYYQSGDIYQLGLYLKVSGVPREMYVLLDIPPNHLKPRALQEALSKNRTLFIRYREKTCAEEKHDKILKISIQTMKGIEDITASFLTESAFKETTRTGLKK